MENVSDINLNQTTQKVTQMDDRENQTTQNVTHIEDRVNQTTQKITQIEKSLHQDTKENRRNVSLLESAVVVQSLEIKRIQRDKLGLIQEELFEHGRQLDKHGRQIDDHDRQIDDHTRQIDDHSRQIDDHDRRIDDHDEQIDYHYRRINQHKRQIDHHKRQIDNHDRQIDDHDRQIDDHDRQIDDHGNIKDDHGRRIDEQSRQIQTQETKLKQEVADIKLHMPTYKAPLKSEHDSQIDDHWRQMDNNKKQRYDHIIQINDHLRQIHHHQRQIRHHNRLKYLHVRQIDDHDRQIDDHDRQIDDHGNDIDDYGRRTDEESRPIQAQETKLKQEVADIKLEMPTYKAPLKPEHGRQMDDDDRQIDDHKRQIDHHKRQIDHHNRQIDHHKRQMDDHDRQIYDRARQIDYHVRQIDDHCRQIDDHGRQIDDHGNDIDDHGRRIEEQSRQIQTQETRVSEHDRQIDDHWRHIDDHRKQRYDHIIQRNDHIIQRNDHFIQIKDHWIQIHHHNRLKHHHVRQNDAHGRQIDDHDRQIDDHDRQIDDHGRRIEEEGRQIQAQETKFKQEEADIKLEMPTYKAPLKSDEMERTCSPYAKKLLQDAKKEYESTQIILCRDSKDDAVIIGYDTTVSLSKIKIPDKYKGILRIKHPKNVSDEAFVASKYVLENKRKLGAEEQNIIQRCINQHSSNLWKAHSNLTMISGDCVKYTGGIPKDTVCIVLYCLSKGFIPFEEDTFPTFLQENGKSIEVDVREGYFQFGPNNLIGLTNSWNDPVCMGSSIANEKVGKTGSVGPFVNLPNEEIGFLTCCHVLFDCIHLPSVDKSLEEPQRGQICNDPPFVIQPSSSSAVCGRDIIKMRCGYVKRAIFRPETFPVSIDAALVKITNRIPSTGHFAVSEYTEITETGYTRESPPMYTGGKIIRNIQSQDREKPVIKSGNRTGLTKGEFRLNGLEVRIAEDGAFLGDRLYHPKRVMKGQYEVRSSMTFFDLGDSGSGVFLKDPDGSLKCIGIAIGRTSFYGTVVTPIGAVLQALELEEKDMTNFGQPMD